MDPLTTLLAERASAPQQHATTPPAEKRYSTAQQMQAAYQNGWSPNPILIRLLEGQHGTTT